MGVPVHSPGSSAFAHHGGGLVVEVEVEVVDVKTEGLIGSRRGVIEEPSQRLFANRKILAAPYGFELAGGDDMAMGSRRSGRRSIPALGSSVDPALQRHQYGLKLTTTVA